MNWGHDASPKNRELPMAHMIIITQIPAGAFPALGHSLHPRSLPSLFFPPNFFTSAYTYLLLIISYPVEDI